MEVSAEDVIAKARRMHADATCVVVRRIWADNGKNEWDVVIYTNSVPIPKCLYDAQTLPELLALIPEPEK